MVLNTIAKVKDPNKKAKRKPTSKSPLKEKNRKEVKFLCDFNASIIIS